MMKNNEKIIAIVGPTASGKTALSIKLAKKINGEIISADSRQIYRGMNIGTGKVTKKEMAGIPHYMLDIASPKKRYTVIEYKEQAEIAIKKIKEKNKIPIICGGTGFYISALLDDIVFPNVPPNNKLRTKLEKFSTKKLFEMLKKIDQNRAKNIDQKNKRRIIRAIEISRTLGFVPSLLPINPNPNIFWIGITLKPEVLKEKIHNRLLSRIKSGMINEAKNLHKKGLAFKRMEELGLEYRYLSRFLTKKIPKNEMLIQLENEIWHYARRQITWFNRDKRINWFSPNQYKKIESETKKFLNN